MNTQTATESTTPGSTQEGPASEDPGEPAPCEGEQLPEHSPILIEVISGSVSIEETIVSWLKDQIGRCINHMEHSFPAINILLVNDERMQALHNRHKGDDSTTDVLTFDTPDEVEIVVCVDIAARNAKKLGHSTEQELLLYALHGLLHCAGYDDHRQADFDAMHKEEDRILNTIGVGTTFNSNAKPRHGGEGDSTVRDTDVG